MTVAHVPYEDLRRANAPLFDEYCDTFTRTLETGRYVLGKGVARFEQEWAAYCGAKHAVGVGSIACRTNLRVVEDCAQSHDARCRGRMTGTFGDCGAYGFCPTKNLGALPRSMTSWRVAERAGTRGASGDE